MAENTVQAPLRVASDCATLNDLGEHVYRLAALLRSATNTDPDHPDDEGWLVDLAYREAVKLEMRYREWAYASTEERK